MDPVEPEASAADCRFMELALEEARTAAEIGEVPVGAVVVDAGNRVVARAHNLREIEKDASAHAEFLAMRQAMDELDAWRLEGCTVYVTLEPCIMCAGLMQQARIGRCVFGAYDPKGGALGTLYTINDDARLNHRFPVEGGVMEEECADILRGFFKERRKHANKPENQDER